jgi:phosphoglycerol transferase MdoB-like AlkP superfamily enzyme
MKQVVHSQYRFLLLLAAQAFITFTITRLVLAVYSFTHIQQQVGQLLLALLVGLVYDAAVISFMLLPFVFIVLVWPSQWIIKRRTRYLLYAIVTLTTVLLIFGAVAEGFFWEEFNTRFNFIAVDYLIYTTEVVGNIQQSYSLEIILPLILVAAILITLALRKVLSETTIEALPFKTRLQVSIFYLALPTASLLLHSNHKNVSGNSYVNQLAGNGLYELFSAYRNNEIDYDMFYKRVRDDDAFKTIRALLKTPEAAFVSDDVFNLERNISHNGPEKRLNVILISVESFSASFMKAFGNKKGITPHLDSLANHSLFFTNLFATGTRTVRGLEALSIALPPTPGQSIVRRPENENMFSLGSVFKSKGYDCKFIYGGYGYFDNMNYFFQNNSYEAIDRVSISSDSIHFENVWGVADEDLFTFAKQEISKSVTKKKPFFTHIMTTSNHRPFTYPEGRIDIPSHTGRGGAVKYTDFAIGDFIKKCSAETWFDSTVFVIVADHCASSAGETDLPVNKYHIPMLVYSPKHIEPQKVDYLMSQIDVAPTLLGLLNFSYTSRFFGYDIFQTTPNQRRVFISTYQLLGYMKNNELIVLGPQQKSEAFQVDANTMKVISSIQPNTAIEKEAISWYEAASYAFQNRLTHIR